MGRDTLTHWANPTVGCGNTGTASHAFQGVPGRLINGRITRLLAAFGPLAVLRDRLRGAWSLPARELCRWNLQTPAAIGLGFDSLSHRHTREPLQCPGKAATSCKFAHCEQTLLAS